MNERYSRQIRYRHIGQAGQECLLASRVAVIGMGALGSVSASLLARAGVGFIRIVDRDLVELSNLQRQILYTERDAAEDIPKVFAAAEHLAEGNSEIEIDPVFADLNSSNCKEIIGDVDLVIDATDNIETRYLINEFCVEYQVPWIYGGAVGSEGMTANFIPGGPCFSCFTGHSNADGFGSGRTCSTEGVLNSLTSIIASYQVTEAIKILTGSDNVRRDVLFAAIWDNDTEYLSLEKDPNCPICGRKEYHYLGKAAGTSAISMCGKDAYQIVPAGSGQPDMEALEKSLSELGEVRVNRFYLQFHSDEASFKLFADGRAIIEHVNSPGKAKSVYSEYIGL